MSTLVLVQTSRLILLVCVLIFAVMAILFYFVYQAATPHSSDSILLKEYGIELTTPAILSDLTYEAVGIASDAVLHMETTYITDTSGKPCELGTFREIQKDAVGKPGSQWSQKNIDAAKFANNSTPAQVKEFTDFYLIFEPSQAVCTQNTRLTQSETDKRTALWNALTTAQFAS